MGIYLHLGSQLSALADALRQQLATDRQADPPADPLVPTTIVVPNPYVRRWLQWELARHSGIAINCAFPYLEEGLWDLLRRLDPRPAAAPERLGFTTLEVTLAAALLADLGQAAPDPELAPLREYLVEGNGTRRHDFSRRLWQLAGRLANSFREYEYHRQDLVAAWLGSQPDVTATSAADYLPRLERCQAQLYRQVVGPEGLAARLGGLTGRRLLSLPRYADEVLRLAPAPPADDRAAPAIHVFGLSLMSAFHRDLLLRLGNHCRWHLYQVNVCAEFWEDVTTPAEDSWHARLGRAAVPAAGSEEELQPDPHDNVLLKAWGKPGRENLKLLSDLEERSQGRVTFTSVWLPRPVAATTVLQRVQAAILTRRATPAPERVRQDCSVQVAGCPGLWREVETVYQSIVHNLHTTPALRQNEIVVYVPDLAAYEAAITDVFGRQPRLLDYRVSGAGSASLYAQAVNDLLLLAGGRFSRKEFFALVRNPCFQAKHGLSQDDLECWTTWAEELCIYHSFDQADKRRRGYADNLLYTWRQGLQRLRLGRIMEASNPGATLNPLHFSSLVPYRDAPSSDPAVLDAFCTAAETLFGYLTELRAARLTGSEWATRLSALCDATLDVPTDAPAEARVRRQCRERLRQLALLDAGLPPDARSDFALAAEYCRQFLADLTTGGAPGLHGGVTIAPLLLHCALPFRVVYILGLGEGVFPRLVTRSSLDLRQVRRRLGDIAPDEEDRYVFLEALMAAGEKLYLTYVSHDLQRDQRFAPSSLLVQLTRFLDEAVLDQPFRAVEMPLRGASHRYLQVAAPAAVAPPASGASAPLLPGDDRQDLLVNYDRSDRLVCLCDLLNRPQFAAVDPLKAQVAARREELVQLVRPPDLRPSPTVTRAWPDTLSLWDLKAFLENPVGATLRRDLRHEDEDDEDHSLREDEPFASDPHQLRRQLLDPILKRQLTVPPPADHVAPGLRGFDVAYTDHWRRGLTPDQAFARHEHHQQRRGLQAELRAPDFAQLRELVADPAQVEFYHEVGLGCSRGEGERIRRFPAPVFTVTVEGQSFPLRLIGTLTSVWRRPATGEAGAVVLVDAAPKGQLPWPWLVPFLFYQAALCADEPAADGISARQWLGAAGFWLYLLSPSGATKVVFHSDPATARQYLTELLGDCLGPASLDLLPLALIRGITDPRPYDPEAPATAEEKAEYAQRLQADYEAELDDPYASFHPPPLLRILEPRVPADAYDKVARRFGPLIAALKAPNGAVPASPNGGEAP